jgi:hypothetical protein
MYVGGYASSIVCDSTGSIGVECRLEEGSMTSKSLIDAIVHHFPDEVMKAIGSRRTNVPTSVKKKKTSVSQQMV